MLRDPPSEDVHGQFYTILLLTQLFTTINNHGKLTLAGPNAPWKPFDDPAHQGHNLVLNAIITLLVYVGWPIYNGANTLKGVLVAYVK
jgi:hypothetical protein